MANADELYNKVIERLQLQSNSEKYKDLANKLDLSEKQQILKESIKEIKLYLQKSNNNEVPNGSYWSNQVLFKYKKICSLLDELGWKKE